MIIDSNIIIYSALPQFASIREFIRRESPVVSVISRIEVLGYHGLEPQARVMLEGFFDETIVLPMIEMVVEDAIRLRQRHRMKLGDAIIAATALTFGHPLATRNVRDFKDVVGLAVLDPLA